MNKAELSDEEILKLIARENAREMWKNYKEVVESGVPEYLLKDNWHSIAWWAKHAGMSMREIADV
jgi:hypothetical protein